MTEDQIEETEYVDVRIYGIPKEDFDYFREIWKLHEGDRVKAFRALLDCYNREQITGELLLRIQRIEQRIQELENRERVEKLKTFGVGVNG